MIKPKPAQCGVLRVVRTAQNKKGNSFLKESGGELKGRDYKRLHAIWGDGPPANGGQFVLALSFLLASLILFLSF